MGGNSYDSDSSRSSSSSWRASRSSEYETPAPSRPDPKPVRWDPPTPVATPARSSSTSGSGRRASSTSAASGELRDPAPGRMEKARASGRKVIATGVRNPVVVFFDGTGSNETQAKDVRRRLESFWGQVRYPGVTIEQVRKIESGELVAPQPYLDDYAVVFGVTGDANVDHYPLVVGDFAMGRDLELQIDDLVIEGGGGGGRMETYELGMYYLAHKCQMNNPELFPFAIFFADEAPYPSLDSDHITEFIGDNPEGDLSTRQVFADLMEKFKGNVFVILRQYGGGSERYCIQEIRDKWLDAVGQDASRIVDVYDEESIVDLMLGIIALVSKRRDLAGYLKDLKGKEQTEGRIEAVKKSLSPLARHVNQQDPLGSEGTVDRKSGARRR